MSETTYPFSADHEYEPEIARGRQISFRVYGQAKPQGSKRHVGKGRMIEAVKGLGDWRRVVGQVAGERAREIDWELIDGPIELDVTVYRLPPKTPKWKVWGLPATKPDADKLARAIGDALEEILYTEDSRITDLHVQKRFGIPGAMVILTELLEVANPKLQRGNDNCRDGRTILEQRAPR